MQEREPEEQVDDAAKEMESSVEEMEERSDRLGDEVDSVKSDWESKRKASNVPGAQPPPEDDDGED
jgi:hypothetical protein